MTDKIAQTPEPTVEPGFCDDGTITNDGECVTINTGPPDTSPVTSVSVPAGFCTDGTLTNDGECVIVNTSTAPADATTTVAPADATTTVAPADATTTVAMVGVAAPPPAQQSLPSTGSADPGVVVAAIAVTLFGCATTLAARWRRPAR